MNCTESCVDAAYIGTGDMQTCASLTTLNTTRRQASIHTVDFTCMADAAFTGYMIDIHCADASTGETVISGLPVDL